MKPTASQGIALFDLDQTLIPWDTQLLFANWVMQHEPLRRLYLLVYLPFTPLAKLLGSEGMKRVFLSYLWGMKRSRLEALATSFVEEVVPKHCYAEMLEVLDEQKRLGRRTVLMTASPDFYGEKIGRALGFDEVICTPVEFDEAVPLFPDLPGGNNKGEAKLMRLRALDASIFAEDGPLNESSAFSDSHADLPMLRLCQKAMMVHPTDKLAAEGGQKGWELASPQRPTKGKLAFALSCAKQALGIWKF